MMKTKTIMTVSSLFLGTMGIVLSFLPDETAAYLKIGKSPDIILLLQLMGALYLAFSVLNWMAKSTLIGGIYNKPIAAGNLAHFVTAAIALIKTCLHHEHPPLVTVVTIVYIVFAMTFVWVFVSSPAINQSKK